MQIYLPIAEMAVNPVVLALVGLCVGVISGLFGVGGGFLLTPVLVMVGIPPGIAVASQTPQVCATSLTGAIGHWRRGAVDVRLAAILLAGGVAGVGAGVALFGWLQAVGQIDVVIAIAYVVLLLSVGGLMLRESVAVMAGRKPAPGRGGQPGWMRALPFKVRLPRSGLYISLLPPLAIGFVVGVLAAILGVGGGFLMAPALVYLLRVPTRVMVGTSLLQVVALSAVTAFLHATFNQNLDVLLAAILMVGGVIGVEIGVQLGARLKAEQLRALLASLMLIVGVKVAADLVTPPAEPFVLGAGR